MKERIFYTPGGSEAVERAAAALKRRGLKVAAAPGPEVTHLLLAVPCRQSEEEIKSLMAQLRDDVKVLGGFLNRPSLKPYRCFDLLEDEIYLARNAKITAYGAIETAQRLLTVTWEDCPVLILGGGRIGKCLAQLLKGLGAQPVIALRSQSQRAMLDALGFETEILGFPAYLLSRFRVIFNTVPAPVLSRDALQHCREECLKIELASMNGLEGDDIITARGLPGLCAPESSGRLIARTVLRLCAGKEADA